MVVAETHEEEEVVMGGRDGGELGGRFDAGKAELLPKFLGNSISRWSI